MIIIIIIIITLITLLCVSRYGELNVVSCLIEECMSNIGVL